MKWIVDFLRGSITWVASNPILIVLVLLVLLFNHFTTTNEIKFDPNSVYRGDLIWSEILSTIHTLFETSAFWFGALGVIAAAAITIFETGAMFAIFTHEKHPMLTGVRYVTSLKYVAYLVYQTVILTICSAILLAIAYGVIVLLGFRGIGGPIALVCVVAIGYPLLYMALITGATILSTDASTAEKVEFFRVALRPHNFWRLVWFYVVRIGTEVTVSYIGLVVVQSFGLPSIIRTIIILSLIAVPFSLVRTAGFLLKLDIFSGEMWFQQFFQLYYRNKPEALSHETR